MRKHLSFNKKKIFFFVFGILILSTFIRPYITPEYLYRVLLWQNSDIKDYEKFPERIISNTPPVFHFKKDPQKSLPQKIQNITYKSNNQQKTIGNINTFLEQNNTTAFIIIKDDTILYENYFNGYTRESINTSLSTAKSFTSALVGIALQEGYIKNINDPINKYLPELSQPGIQNITIKNLLLMNSGLRYNEGLLWLGDDAKTYYTPNLRKLALQETKIQTQPNQYFHYNNYHPLLLGLILERTTSTSISNYLQEKIWKQIGAEFPASWSLDSKESGFEKMESGINARSIDFANFGRLFLNKGNWNGKQIIPQSWITESTQETHQPPEYYKNMDHTIDKEKTYYQYMWWGYRTNTEESDYYARGKYGQYIYISPSTNTIIVRNGSAEGEVDFWPEILYQITQTI